MCPSNCTKSSQNNNREVVSKQNMADNATLRTNLGMLAPDAISNNDENIQKLNELDFPYDTEYKHVKGVKKKMTVYICKFDN